MPSASIGTKAPVEAALLADSGPATPATAPLPNSSGCFGDALLQRIGEEARNDVRRARDDADEEAEHACRARSASADSRHSLRFGNSSRSFGRDDLAGDAVARRRQDFAEAEQADRDRHDADAVAELGDVEASSGSARSCRRCRCMPSSSPNAAISSVRASEVDDM